jgi:hypothetical protein
VFDKTQIVLVGWLMEIKCISKIFLIFYVLSMC